MNKRVGVGLAGVGAKVLALAGAAVHATAAGIPRVAATVVEDMALPVAEGRADAVFAVGLLGTVECATAHLGGEVGAGNAENLFGHNMVDALLQVGNLLFQSCQQPFGNLAQEDSAFAAWVKKARLAGAEQLLWQQVEHSVSQLGRGEDLVAGKVCQAVEDVGAIYHNEELEIINSTFASSIQGDHR